MKVSVLVISRTAQRLNRMLTSLEQAYGGAEGDLEVLCSWNGSRQEWQAVDLERPWRLQMIEQPRYHFATNANALARLATGDILALLNDDLVLDPGALDAALLPLDDPTVAVVGGRLRTGRGLVAHIGIAFDPRHSPYHRLCQLPHDSEPARCAGPVPAVTGALMLIRARDFAPTGLDEGYRVCGEDVDLCLRLRAQGRRIWYCPDASGVHDGEATRSEVPGQEACPEDLDRLRDLHRAFLAAAPAQEWQLEWQAQAEESDHLRRLLEASSQPGDPTFRLARALLELDDLRRHTQSQARTIDTLQRKQIRSSVSKEPAMR